MVDCPADALAVVKDIPDELKSAICVFYAAEVVEAILFEGDSDQLSILPNMTRSNQEQSDRSTA